MNYNDYYIQAQNVANEIIEKERDWIKNAELAGLINKVN